MVDTFASETIDQSMNEFTQNSIQCVKSNQFIAKKPSFAMSGIRRTIGTCKQVSKDVGPFTIFGDSSPSKKK